MADGLAGLPRDYAGIPRQAPPLGPPLPGDLGRPDAERAPRQTQPSDRGCGRSGAATSCAGDRGGAIEPAVCIDQYPGAGRSIAPHRRRQQHLTPAPRRTADSAIDRDAFAQNGQDRKLAFVNASVDRRTTSPDRLAAPASPYVVQAGTVIPASLITGIRSDLPGQITAQVTENVYDSPTGRFLLIPQGTRLIGIYDSQVAFGQSRVLLVWTRLIMPNGTLDCAGAPAGRRHRRLCRAGGRGRQPLGRAVQGRAAVHACSASAANLDLPPVPAAIAMSSPRSVVGPAIA